MNAGSRLGADLLPRPERADHVTQGPTLYLRVPVGEQQGPHIPVSHGSTDIENHSGTGHLSSQLALILGPYKKSVQKVLTLPCELEEIGWIISGLPVRLCQNIELNIGLACWKYRADVGQI